MKAMGKAEKKGKSTRRRVRAEGEEDIKTAPQIEVLNIESDDDSRFKIVRKDTLRQCNEASTSNIDLEDDEMAMNCTGDKIKNKESKKKKRKKLEAELKSVPSDKDANFEIFCSDLFVEEEKLENGKISEVVGESVKTDPVEAPDDTVLRKLLKEEKLENRKISEVVDESVKMDPVEAPDDTVLRKLLGPRYFDPPDSSWGMCYNCGEEGHMAVNCTSAKRKKPCFVCGSQEHLGKQCPKGQDCYICRKGGHRAKDCPEKGKKGARNSKICLKCGDSGHEMFSCGTDYFSDDLKEIECYVCGNAGHLCCVNYTHSSLREPTCYRCGLPGHTGLACSGSQKTAAYTGGPDGSCFRCGEQGHFARECTNAGKRNSESYNTPQRKLLKENQDSAEFRSAPQDGGKSRKRKKPKTERGFMSASKPKGKYGWSTEDPEDFTSSRGKTASPWKSPATPKHKRFRIPDYSTTEHASTSYSPRESHMQHYNGSSYHSRHHNGLNFHTQHYNGSASNGIAPFNPPRYSSRYLDHSASNGTATFNQPRYSSRDHSSSYGSSVHHGSRFTSSWQLSNSGSNRSAEFHQPRCEPRFDSSSFGRKRNYDW